MTGRLCTYAKHVIDNVDMSKVSARRVGILSAVEGSMLEADGLRDAIGTQVRIWSTDDHFICGEIVGFRGCRSLIQPFVSDAALTVGARVVAAGMGDMVPCGDALLGRILDAHGDPLDGRPAVKSSKFWPLTGVKNNPLTRGRVTRPLDVGVRAINGLLTIGEGQRLAIIAGSGVGKSVLMGQMLQGVDCDVIVVGLVGERAREVSDFVETKLDASIRPKSVVIAVPADHPPLLRLRGAMRATAIAEFFRDQGKRVFLMIDSLTRVAHAQREIGLALGEPPTMKGYPPSALGMIPRLIERAGANRDSDGSITAIYTVLADGGDLDDPIVDAARAIVDGHIVLSRSLAEQGLYPAIDVAKSLSRTMVDVVDDAHASAAARFRHLWSTYEENRDLLLMGAYAAGRDGALDDAIARRTEMLDYMRQSAVDTVPFAAAREMLIAGFAA